MTRVEVRNALAGYTASFLLWMLAFGILGAVGLDTLTGVLYRDGDSLRHIATGDLMRAEWSATPADPWAFTTAGRNWFNPSWLFNVALSLLHALGGIWLVTLVTAALGMLALALPVLVAQAHGGKFAVSIPVAMLASPLLMAGIAVRPQIMTLVFVPVAVALLWRAQEAGTIKGRTMLLTTLLLVVWINAHGGWPVFVTLAGCWWLWALAFRHRTMFCDYLTAVLTPFILILFSPRGPKMFSQFLDFFDRQPLTGAIREWQAFDPAVHWVFLPFIVLFVVGILANFRDAWKSPLVWAACAWLVLSLLSVRHIYIFASLGLTAAAWLLGKKLKDSVPLARLEHITRTQVLGMLPAAALVSLLLLPSTFSGVHLPNRYTLAEEAAWLREHRPDARVLNRYNDGGALVFALRGSPRIFIDDRAETLFPREVQLDAIRLAEEPESGPEIAAKYDAGLALFPIGHATADAFEADPQWRIIHTGPDAVVFERKD